MPFSNRNLFIIACFSFVISCFFFCSSPSPKYSPEKTSTSYLNHSDTARYVGMTQCKLCHQDIYNSFLNTGMGMSFDTASKQKSSARFDKHSVVYDPHSDLSYYPYWQGESFLIEEFRLDGKDTVYKRVEKVDFVIGSGQHTNSHLSNTNGYMHQMPMTFYTQQNRWDLPPGFENGMNTRFSRKIGLECMTCHNAYPEYALGSENKYINVPNGIDCERCHGPGSIHVQQKMAGIIVDTSRYIDYSIVNPGKLSVDLQFDVCQRCHLQGNAVLKENKSFFDFKPGMKLSDILTVFLPRYEGAEDKFIMASHADRLKMSKCFMESVSHTKVEGALKPSKGALTCITCHDPHVSVKVTGKEVFNSACINCHSNPHEKMCSEKESVRKTVGNNCVSCHMPRSGSIDIPHVTVTDHFIRKPLNKKEEKEITKFLGLYAVNESSPSDVTIAKAYINQYEKFEQAPYYLDSALKYLSDNTNEEIKENFSELVHLHFCRDDYDKVLYYAEKFKEEDLLSKMLSKKSWSNDDAWTCYRIGQAYQNKGDINKAGLFYTKATGLAPFVSEFLNKLATVNISLNQLNLADAQLQKIISEDAGFAPAYCNLGYIHLLKNNPIKADLLYNKALALDPDYEQAWMNKAGLYIYNKQFGEARKTLVKILKKNPDNFQAKKLLNQLDLLK